MDIFSLDIIEQIGPMSAKLQFIYLKTYIDKSELLPLGKGLIAVNVN